MMVLVITGRKEEDILKDIVSMVTDLDLLESILSDWEKAQGLFELKSAMQKYFEVR